VRAAFLMDESSHEAEDLLEQFRELGGRALNLDKGKY